MSQAPQSAFLDLTHPFTRDTDQIADLFQGQRLHTIESEVEADDLLLTLIQTIEHVFELTSGRSAHELGIGGALILIWDDVQQRALFIIIEGTVQRTDGSGAENRIGDNIW